MKLRELEPQFLRYVEEGGAVFHRVVGAIGEADGIKFLCPKCFAANGGACGTHSVICWSPRVPAGARPGPGRWDLVGAGVDDLSLVAGSSSVQLAGGCAWHGHVTKGEVTSC